MQNGMEKSEKILGQVLLLAYFPQKIIDFYACYIVVLKSLWTSVWSSKKEHKKGVCAPTYMNAY